MDSMDIHLGVVRDREAIHALLLNTRASRRQLAVCFSSEGNLMVRICHVIDVTSPENTVILSTRMEEGDEQFQVALDTIRSVYPIRDFAAGEHNEKDWTPERSSAADEQVS